MALSSEEKRVLNISVGGSVIGDGIAAEIDKKSTNIAAIGTTTDLVGVDGTGSNAAPLTGTESRLDVIEAKVDEIIAALVSAGLMA